MINQTEIRPGGVAVAGVLTQRTEESSGVCEGNSEGKKSLSSLKCSLKPLLMDSYRINSNSGERSKLLWGSILPLWPSGLIAWGCLLMLLPAKVPLYFLCVRELTLCLQL